MSDAEIIFNFADNNKGSLELNGTAVELLSLLSEEVSKPKEISYSFKSDSILMIRFDSDSGSEYQKFGVIREYDDEYEEATCRVCNSSHEANVKSRVALRESHIRNGPIVSAICVFNEGIKMSNILAESLIDLHQYFV
jgi:hypothetical protein